MNIALVNGIRRPALLKVRDVGLQTIDVRASGKCLIRRPNGFVVSPKFAIANRQAIIGKPAVVTLDAQPTRWPLHANNRLVKRNRCFPLAMLIGHFAKSDKAVGTCWVFANGPQQRCSSAIG